MSILQPILTTLAGAIALYVSTFYPDIGGDWVVSLMEGEPFVMETVLPGRFHSVVGEWDSMRFSNGNCSFAALNCTYFYDEDNNTRLTLSGTMRPDYFYTTFRSDEFPMPITVYFLSNNTWYNYDNGMIQPHLSLPLIINPRGLDAVTFTFAYLDGFGNLGPQFYYGKDMIPLNATSGEFKQIVNYAYKAVPLLKRHIFTVEQREPIDFYIFEVGGRYLTKAINWNRKI